MNDLAYTFGSPLDYLGTQWGVLSLPELGTLCSTIRERRLARVKLLLRDYPQMDPAVKFGGVRDLALPEINFADLSDFAYSPDGAKCILEASLKKSGGDVATIAKVPNWQAPTLALVTAGLRPPSLLYGDAPPKEEEADANPPAAAQE
jgi:hypothetical protein